MLDRYLWGRVDRISPEAPVPIVDIYAEENRPGGAANVALNLLAMGSRPFVAGMVGDDTDGHTLLGLGTQHGFEMGATLVLPGRRTTAKIRVLGNGQQVLRVDKEDRDPIDEPTAALLLAGLEAVWSQVGGVVLQDYDKGLFTPWLIGELIAAATRRGLPVAVDPKFRNFGAYTGCTLFKPNLKELNEGLGLHLAKDDLAGIAAAVARLRAQMPHPHTLVTLGDHGMLLVDAAGVATHLPARRRAVADVSGAGDTVIGLMALGLATGLDLRQAATLANIAGGQVCEETGVVPVDPGRLRSELAAVQP